MNRMRQWSFQSHVGALSVIVLSAILAILAFQWVGYDYGQFSSEVMPASRYDPLAAGWTVYQAIDNLLHRPLDLGYSPALHGDPASFGYTIAPYGIAVAVLPVYLLSGQDLELTLNLYFLSTFVLTAWAAYILIRYLLVVPQSAAVLMALSVAFAQYRFAQIWHIESLSLQFYILAVYCLHRLIDSPGWRWAVGLAVMFWFTMLTSGYLGMAFIVTAGVIGLYVLIQRWELLTRRLFAALLLSAGLAVVLCLPFMAFRFENESFSAGYPLKEAMLYSAEPREWLSGTSFIYSRWVPAKNGEVALFVGFTPLILAFIGWHYRRRGDVASADQRKFSMREVVIIYAIVTLVGYLLSLGPVLQMNGERIVGLPYLMLFQVPGVPSLRAPARFIFMAVTGLAVLGAYALAVLNAYAPRQKYIVVLGIVILCLTIELVPDTLSGSRRILDPGTPTLLAPKTVYMQTRKQEKLINDWLATQPRDTVIFHYPSQGAAPVTAEALRIYLFDQRFHGLEMINGWSSYLPIWFNELARFPDPSILYLLLERDTRYVLVHNEFLSSEEQQTIKARIGELAVNQDIQLPLLTTVGSVDVYDLGAIQMEQVMYQFDTIMGRGWSPPEIETNGATVEWTSAPEATLTLPVFTDVPLQIDFSIISSIQRDILDSLTLHVDGLPVTLSRQGTLWWGAIPQEAVADDHRLHLTFRTNRTISPQELGINTDTRQLGVRFDWLRLTPLSDAITWEFDTVAPGTGWQYPETAGGGEITFEWTSAPEATLHLPLVVRSALQIEFRVLDGIQPDVLDSLTLEVNGIPIPLKISRESGQIIYSGTIPEPAPTEDGQLVLTFRTNRTASPQELGISADARQLGVRFDWLRIKPVE